MALISSQRADGLMIASDEAPRLLFGTEERALSMPPIPKPTVEGFAREIAVEGSDDPAGVSESVECRYQTQGGDEFDVRIERDGEVLRLVVRPAGSSAEVQAISDPDTIAPWPDPPAPLGRSSDPTSDSSRHSTPESTPDSTRDSTPDSAQAASADPHVSLDPTLIDLLSRLERERASDLILSAGAGARLRSGGFLREVAGPAFSSADILALVAPAMSDASHERLKTHGSVDLALDLNWSGETTRYRVNVFEQQRGLAAALRPIRSDIPTLSKLNLPDHLYPLAEYPDGLVLVTGPTGSGKSSTLAALVEHLNRSVDLHIITLEDPVEYQYDPRRCLIHQREVGRHVESFAAGLRAALREDPDVILVGEMRDRETIAAALTAAETGHLVLSTLHSGSPSMSIDRMIDVFAPDQQGQVRLQLSDVLRAVLSQQLLPSTTRPARVPAFEMLHVTSAVASQIREGKLHQLKNSIQTGRDVGMVSLERSLIDLLQDRKIDTATAQTAARDDRVLADLSASLRVRSAADRR